MFSCARKDVTKDGAKSIPDIERLSKQLGFNQESRLVLLQDKFIGLVCRGILIVLETRRQLLNITAQDVLPQLPSCLFRIVICYAEFVFVSYAEENIFLYAFEFFYMAFKEVPKWCFKLGHHGSLLLFFHLGIL